MPRGVEVSLISGHHPPTYMREIPRGVTLVHTQSPRTSEKVATAPAHALRDWLLLVPRQDSNLRPSSTKASKPERGLQRRARKALEAPVTLLCLRGPGKNRTSVLQLPTSGFVLQSTPISGPLCVIQSHPWSPLVYRPEDCWASFQSIMLSPEPGQ